MKLLLLTIYSLLAFTIIYWGMWYGMGWIALKFPSYSILAMIYIVIGTGVLGGIVWVAVKLGEGLMEWL